MPKKTVTQNFRDSQAPSISPPHPYTVSIPRRPLSPIEDDDDDDICPVCESECTCHNRANQPSLSRSLALTPTSTSTSTKYSHPSRPVPSSATHLPSLKIKLTVPPNLKFRKTLTSACVPQPSRAVASSPHILDPTAPKRRGRPPKAIVAAREAAKAALAASHFATTDRSHGPPLRSPFTLASAPPVVLKKKTRPLNKKTLSKLNGKERSRGRGATDLTVSSLSSLSDSDHHAQFPTFMSAASSSSLTSSSESSEIDSDNLSSSDSDMEDEERFILQSERDKARLKKEILGDESGQKRRGDVPSNRWEIKPRKKSVSAGESDSEGDSEESSEEEEEADDEDDDEADDDDEAMSANVEETGLIMHSVFKDPDEDENDGKLGVSFDGLPSGWSEDEDEESSFDAELFFANLEDSSDSDVSPAFHNEQIIAEKNGHFSADEEDALLLMDVDSSTRIRRTSGEFEVGVDLDSLSIGLDGGLLPSPFGPFDIDMTFDGSTESDVEMTVGEDSTSDSDELALVETDGETTEDELVDSDGLPNSRAMMMFRWPTSVSTIDPQSTMSPGGILSATPGTPDDASHTTRIALASITTQQRSSPAPTPADILAGKISMDDLDEIEISNEEHAESSRSNRSNSRRTRGGPIMGQFVPIPADDNEGHAIVDGSGLVTPSPFPHSRTLRAKHRKMSSLRHNVASADPSTDVEPTVFSAVGTPMSLIAINTTSSDELASQALRHNPDGLPLTEVIDLGDVLDASLLDSEHEVDPNELGLGTWTTPRTPVAGTHLRSLTRWDRIPVATFRRTRETPVLNTTPASDTGISGRFASIGTLNNDMLGTPKLSVKSKTSLKSRSKNNTNANMLVISPVLLPIREGDRTPTNAGPSSAYSPLLHEPLHQQKSRRDQRKEKAMLKKKMIGKYAANSPNRPVQRHHRSHHPNMKGRGNSSVQRTQFPSSSSSHVPHLNL
ncbi:hypothetical protein BDY19DRAFT_971482 [Irpex rosettiformis]|uniref:Uncharacterized protein n=1 Tax=Irpex rosettiformis TaxID=378272 RepID=A0ACB8TR41_9APHY|nr:hypothetical protein BDY19DRAFT_971482 [Irpex rosettiformis]